jgi:hypothetical protein
MGSDATAVPRGTTTLTEHTTRCVSRIRRRLLTTDAEATREEMREARLPLAYRDSCAGLLIPLNKCRRETWYAPWKCEVSHHNSRDVRQPRRGTANPIVNARNFKALRRGIIADVIRQYTGRTPQLREVPIRRIQEARLQDGGAEGVKGRCEEQLEGSEWVISREPALYKYRGTTTRGNRFVRHCIHND